jgi:uncharacterized protein (TIGR02271 family)
MLRGAPRNTWHGRPAYARGGEPIGSVVRTHGDGEWPELVVVDRGDRYVAFPAAEVVVTREDVRLPWAADRLRAATPLDRGAEDDAAAVRRAAEAFVQPASRPLAEDPDAMIVSEERLDVRVEAVPTERVVLRKHVVEEQVTVPVVVRREELELVREPIAGAAADPGAHLGDAVPHEIVLYAERPVVTTEVVPVERVRLGKRFVSEERVVSGDVRREDVAVERSEPYPPTDS